MSNKSPFALNNKLKKSIILLIIESILGGCNFLVLFNVLKFIFLKNVEYSTLLKYSGILALIFIFRIIIYSVGYTQSQVGGANVSRNLRVAFGDKLKKIPLYLFTDRMIGDYIGAATTEISNYEKILTHKIADIIKYIVLAIMLGGFALYLNYKAGIVILLSTALLLPTLLFTFYYVRKYGVLKINGLNSNVSTITEYITGIQTLRSYNMGGTKNKEVVETMKNFSNISYIYEKVLIPIGQVYFVISGLAFPFVVFISGNAYLNGAMDISTLIILTVLPMFLIRLNQTLFISLTSYRNLKISKNNIEKILFEEEEIKASKDLLPKKYDIEFNHINYEYVKNEPILKDMSFKIKENSFCAIVGDSGCGKSTILNLISKYYVPQDGYITIGGFDISKYPSQKVLSLIASVDQDVFLFNDTVRNNILYANPNASEADIIKACKLSNCDSFINNMSKGYDTEIGENGNKLSGGEKQRISVARAIIKDSPIILLDEATASLDIENEILVKQAINNLIKKDKTIIMIAHTLSVVKSADNILVVENGKISESGTHIELLKNKGKYYLMFNASQKIN